MNGDLINAPLVVSQYQEKLDEKRKTPQAFFLLDGQNASSIELNTIVAMDKIITIDMPVAGELNNIIKGAFTSGQDTDMKHVKAVAQNFTFKSKNIFLKHNRSHLTNMGLNEEYDLRVLNNLTISYDSNFYNGTTENLGYFNNANNLDIGNTDVGVVGDLISLMAKMQRTIMQRAYCSESEVKFVLSGNDLWNFLFQVTGGIPRTNLEVITGTFGQRWNNAFGQESQGNWIFLEPLVSSVNKVSAFATNRVTAHSAYIPSIYLKGTNQELGYDYVKYIYGSNAVNIIDQGSALQSGVTVTTPTP